MDETTLIRVWINGREIKKDGTTRITYEKSYDFSTEKDALTAIEMLDQCKYGVRNISVDRITKSFPEEKI